MPLRDRFRPPLDDESSWEGFHGGWPMMIVLELGKKLPPRYVAAPRVHLGAFAEIDVSTYEKDWPMAPDRPVGIGGSDEGGGTATAVWSPPEATLTVAVDLPAQDEYEVRVYDTHRGRRLVAAIEMVSPGNKDRPENRRAFVAKCAALLQEQVSVVVVDLVTVRHFNFYADLLELIGRSDPGLGDNPPGIYAAACRTTLQDISGCSKPGFIRWPLATSCRPCRCGWPTTWRCRWNWKPVTRKHAVRCDSLAAKITCLP